MEDKEFIERVRLAREDEVRFFSNAAKPARERWIVREFLQRLDMSISEGDLQSLPEDDDVDVFVECLDAAFQVKELPEANCLRSSEVKAALKRAETALQPMDLYEPLVAMDKIWVDAYPLILECATAAKYPAPSRAKLDLLIYVTRTDAILSPLKKPPALLKCGWRSISCLFGSKSLVLVATTEAPEFLRNQCRRIQQALAADSP